MLDALSQQDLIEINKVCLDKDNGVHIKLKDNRLKRKFKDLLKVDDLMCTREDSMFSMKDGLRECFRNGMATAMCACIKEEISCSTGVLRVDDTSVKLHGPAFNPQFEWRRQNGKIIEISVDLCPVIRIAGEFPELLKLENVMCETYYEYARKINTVMILPTKKGQSCKNGLCFSLVFTETELELMNDLSAHHKQCYMLLKYLLNAKRLPSMGKAFNDLVDTLIEPETAFFSYILKILVLNHHFIQKCTETKCLASCLERILRKIVNIAYFAKMVLSGITPRNWLSNPFFKMQNVWSSHGLKLSDHDLMLKLRFLLMELDAIGDMEEYDYGNCFLYSVRGMNINIILLPWKVAIMIALLSLYLCPELGHLSEKICQWLI